MLNCIFSVGKLLHRQASRKSIKVGSGFDSINSFLSTRLCLSAGFSFVGPSNMM